MNDHDNRREYTRYPLRAFAELDNSNQKWAAHVLDISSQGARIALLDREPFWRVARKCFILRKDYPAFLGNHRQPIHILGRLIEMIVMYFHMFSVAAERIGKDPSAKTTIDEQHGRPGHLQAAKCSSTRMASSIAIAVRP